MTWYWRNTEADNEWYPAADHNFNDAIDGSGTDGTPGDADGVTFTSYASNANCAVDGVVPAAGRLASFATSGYTGTLTIDNAISTVDWLPCKVVLAGAADLSITGRCETTIVTDLGTYSGTWVLDGGGAQTIGASGAADAPYANLAIEGGTAATLIVSISGKALALTEGELDTNRQNLVAAAVTIGKAAAEDKNGVLDLATGIHTIASVVDGNAANTANALDFASSNVKLSGILNGDNIACTNTAGIVNGGTINNVDLTGEVPLLHFTPAGGTGNTNVITPSRAQMNLRHGRAA